MSQCQMPAGVLITWPCRTFVQFDVDMLFSPGCLPPHSITPHSLKSTPGSVICWGQGVTLWNNYFTGLWVCSGLKITRGCAGREKAWWEDARGHSVKWERQQPNLWLHSCYGSVQTWPHSLLKFLLLACSSLPFSTYPESTPPSRLDQINLQVCNEHYSVSKLQNLVSWLCSVCITKALSKDRTDTYFPNCDYEADYCLIKTYWSHFILGGLNYYVLTSKISAMYLL